MDEISLTLWKGKSLDKKSMSDFRSDIDVDPEVLLFLVASQDFYLHKCSYHSQCLL